jgi:hypothetical protein
MDRPLSSRLTTKSEDLKRTIDAQKEETSRVLLKDFNLRLNMLSVPEGGLGKNFEQGLNALEESSPSAKESIQEVRDIIKDIQSKARRGELEIDDVPDEVESIANIILKIKKENAQILRTNMRAKYGR